jgi:hypothetical protein
MWSSCGGHHLYFCGVEDSPHSISAVGQQQQQSFDCKDSVLNNSSLLTARTACYRHLLFHFSAFGGQQLVAVFF